MPLSRPVPHLLYSFLALLFPPLEVYSSCSLILVRCTELKLSLPMIFNSNQYSTSSREVNLYSPFQKGVHRNYTLAPFPVQSLYSMHRVWKAVKTHLDTRCLELFSRLVLSPPKTLSPFSHLNLSLRYHEFCMYNDMSQKTGKL